MLRLQLKSGRPDSEVDALAGTFLGHEHYDWLIEEDAEVRRPDGTPLLIFRKKAVPEELAGTALKALRGAARGAQRGIAGGRDPESGKARIRKLARDGKLSKTNYPAHETPSGIVGYFDRYPRVPFCRTTAFVIHHGERFAAALPYVRHVDGLFKELVPERYAAQRAIAEKTSPDFRIPETAFTTITVNRNWRTAAHRDAGDLPEGFGVLTVLGNDRYKGGYLVFPKWKVAVDVRHRDVLLNDVHELHGNTSLMGVPARMERVSCVLYFRKNMVHCGTAEEELARAKRRRGGEKING